MWKCKQCGACCKFISFQTLISEDEKIWLNAHKGVKVIDNRVVISSRCVHLHRCGNHYTCDLHNIREKPKLCSQAGKKECKLAKELFKEL